MSELRVLTEREWDAVGGGFLNNNSGQNVFNNGGVGGNVSIVASAVGSATGGTGNGALVGAQIGQQVDGVFSLNGIGVVA
jgi:hypothetical protein